MKGGKDIDIKIVGANCKSGMKLSKMVNRAVIEAGLNNIKIQEIDIKDQNKYGITNAPGLIINGKKASVAKVLTVREIKKLLLT